MGMTGSYYAVDDELLKRISGGEVKLFELSFDDKHLLDIDQSWDALHFMLCDGNIQGDDTPQGNVVPMSDGTYMPDSLDMGYEFGAFYLTPEKIAASLEYLDTVDRDTLLSKYEFDVMAGLGVYPIMSDFAPWEFFDYIWANLVRIKEFYENAVREGLSIVFHVC